MKPRNICRCKTTAIYTS